MDYRTTQSQAVQLGNARIHKVMEYNRNIDLARKRAADDLITLKNQAETDANTKAIADKMSSGVNAPYVLAAINNAKDYATGRVAARVPSEAQTASALEEGAARSTAGRLSTNVLSEASAEGGSLAGRTATAGREIAESAANRAGKAVAARVGRSVAEVKAGAATVKSIAKDPLKAIAETDVKAAGKLGSRVVGGAAAALNIGNAADDLASDFKGGHFHLAGSNWEQQASNALQIGSGVADVVGFAFPPAAVAGALFGIASGIFGAIGDKEEGAQKVEEAEKVAKKQEEAIPEKAKVQKIQQVATVKAA